MKKSYLFIVTLLLLAFGIGLFFFLQQKQPNNRKITAVGETVTISLTPATNTVSGEFDVTATLDTNGNDISGADVLLTTSNVGVIKIVSFTPSSTFSSANIDVLLNNVSTIGNNVHFIAVNTTNTSLTSPTPITVGTFTLQTVGPGTASIALSNGTVTAATLGERNVPVTLASNTYAVAATATNTPVPPTNTPVPTATPTNIPNPPTATLTLHNVSGIIRTSGNPQAFVNQRVDRGAFTANATATTGRSIQQWNDTTNPFGGANIVITKVNSTTGNPLPITSGGDFPCDLSPNPNPNFNPKTIGGVRYCYLGRAGGSINESIASTLWTPRAAGLYRVFVEATDTVGGKCSGNKNATPYPRCNNYDGSTGDWFYVEVSMAAPTPTSIPAPTVSGFTIGPPSFPAGSTVTLNWNTTNNPTECHLQRDERNLNTEEPGFGVTFGTSATNTTTLTFPTAGGYLYRMACSNAGGSNVSNDFGATVTALPTNTPVPPSATPIPTATGVPAATATNIPPSATNIPPSATTGCVPGSMKNRGDANNDCAITDADYAIWRATYGSTTDLRADFDGDGRVTIKDFNIWRNGRYNLP